MPATSRKTLTACAVTSGPTPSPGRTTIFNRILPCSCFPTLLWEKVGVRVRSLPRTKPSFLIPLPKEKELLSNSRLCVSIRIGNRHRLRGTTLSANQRDQILIVDSLLTISQVREAMIRTVQFFARQSVTQLLIAQRQRVPAGMLTQHEFVCRHAHRFRRHDFIAQRIADHAVLMNARFMRT